MSKGMLKVLSTLVFFIIIFYLVTVPTKTIPLPSLNDILAMPGEQLFIGLVKTLGVLAFIEFYRQFTKRATATLVGVVKAVDIKEKIDVSTAYRYFTLVVIIGLTSVLFGLLFPDRQKFMLKLFSYFTNPDTVSCEFRSGGLYSKKKSYTLVHAMKIAEFSECSKVGKITKVNYCNERTNLWWIDIKPNTREENCSPACVVDVINETASVDMRCSDN